MLCLDCLRTDDLLQHGLFKSPVSAMTPSYETQTSGDQTRQQPRARVMAVGTPEGLYDLIAERRVNFTFQPDVPTKLTLARLKDETCENYLIANVGQRLVVTRADAVDAKVGCLEASVSEPHLNDFSFFSVTY